MLARLHIVNYGVQKLSIKRTEIGESEQHRAALLGRKDGWFFPCNRP